MSEEYLNMKEGKFYRNKDTGIVFLLTVFNPIFGEGIILYNPKNRKQTGKVEFIGMCFENFEEFKGTLLITTI